MGKYLNRIEEKRILKIFFGFVYKFLTCRNVFIYDKGQIPLTGKSEPRGKIQAYLVLDIVKLRCKSRSCAFLLSTLQLGNI